MCGWQPNSYKHCTLSLWNTESGYVPPEDYLRATQKTDRTPVPGGWPNSESNSDPQIMVTYKEEHSAEDYPRANFCLCLMYWMNGETVVVLPLSESLLPSSESLFLSSESLFSFKGHVICHRSEIILANLADLSMCLLKSPGTSAVCTWGVRGTFLSDLYIFCALLPLVLCAALWRSFFLPYRNYQL